jgi:hypothetical protein
VRRRSTPCRSATQPSVADTAPSSCPQYGAIAGQADECEGESNNTGDLLRTALLIGEAGRPEHYEEAERILRSHLLPFQVLEVADLPDGESEEDGDHRLASRLLGGFSFPTSSDLFAQDDENLVTTDVTSGALELVRGEGSRDYPRPKSTTSNAF